MENQGQESSVLYVCHQLHHFGFVSDSSELVIYKRFQDIVCSSRPYIVFGIFNVLTSHVDRFDMSES
jgi:hypothetical protein